MVRSRALTRNLQRLQLVEDGLHGAVRSAEKDTASHACEGPPQPLEHGLPLYLVAELFGREISIPIALDGQTLPVPFHDQIDTPRTDLPPRNDVVAGLDKILHDIALECGLGPSFLVVEGPREAFRSLRVLDEPAPQVARLKVRLRVQGVHDPHLVTRAAGRVPGCPV